MPIVTRVQRPQRRRRRLDPAAGVGLYRRQRRRNAADAAILDPAVRHAAAGPRQCAASALVLCPLTAAVRPGMEDGGSRKGGNGNHIAGWSNSVACRDVQKPRGCALSTDYELRTRGAEQQHFQAAAVSVGALFMSITCQDGGLLFAAEAPCLAIDDDLKQLEL